MPTKLTCSKCGAEVQSLTIQTPWPQLVFSFTIAGAMLAYALFYVPWSTSSRSAHQYKDDLSVELVELRRNGPTLEVIGRVANNGQVEWENIDVEAEFYDADGTYLDESNDFLRLYLRPGETETFKVQYEKAPRSLDAEGTQTVLKVSHAMYFGH